MICTVDGCKEKHYAGGYCHKHYRRNQRWGDPLIVGPNHPVMTPIPGCEPEVEGQCGVKGCERHIYCRGVCMMHYRRWNKWGSPMMKYKPGRRMEPIPGCVPSRGVSCLVLDCPKPVNTRFLCSGHYARWRRTGCPVRIGPPKPRESPKRCDCGEKLRKFEEGRYCPGCAREFVEGSV